jgi:hypothetical protein
MTEIQPPRRVGRSIVAVLAGVLAIIILSLATDAVLHGTGIFPPMGQPMSDGLFVLTTLYRLIYGVLGGYIAARLAPGRSMMHSMVLGIIGLVLSTAGAIATWNRGPEFGPKWYPLALVVTAIPCAWLGGKIFCLQRQTHS